MTAQKLYERLILITADIAKYDSDNILSDIVETLSDDISFEELCIKANLWGVSIPAKENFKMWGEDYLCQCIYMLEKHRCDFMPDFLDAVFSLPKLKNIAGDNFANACYDIYFSNVMGNHDIAKAVSEVIVKHYADKDFFKKFYTVANATGLIGRIDYSEFLKLNPENRHG